MAVQEMSYNSVTQAALQAFEQKDLAPLELLEKLMDTPGTPMHDPIHHYIMPATLLVLAARAARISKEALLDKLAQAEERARKLLPGFCGWWGACGSAVGCGVFASVWLGASPKKEAHWATPNKFTARCLSQVASVDGPRCCKRTSFLALGEALVAAKELMNLDLGGPIRPECSWSAYNRECRQSGCPFYHKEAGEHGQRLHANLHSRL